MAGRYEFTGEKEGFEIATEDVEIREDQTSNVQLNMVPLPASISGVVNDVNGEPIEDANIELLNVENGDRFTTNTAGNGQITLGVPRGNYTLTAKKTGISRMKKITFLLFVLGIAISEFAQTSDSDNPELGLWSGGSMSMDFFLGTEFINGGVNSSTGGVISPRIQHNSAMLSTNPAMLRKLGTFDLNIDSRFGLGTWLLDSHLDVREEINSEISTETDNLFDDPDNFYRPPGSQIIPTEVSSFNAGLPGGIRSLSFSYPIHERVALAAGYSNAVLTDMNFRLNGITTKMAQEEGSDDVSVRFDVLMNISAYTAF